MNVDYHCKRKTYTCMCADVGHLWSGNNTFLARGWRVSMPKQYQPQNIQSMSIDHPAIEQFVLSIDCSFFLRFSGFLPLAINWTHDCFNLYVRRLAIYDIEKCWYLFRFYGFWMIWRLKKLEYWVRSVRPLTCKFLSWHKIIKCLGDLFMGEQSLSHEGGPNGNLRKKREREHLKPPPR